MYQQIKLFLIFLSLLFVSVHSYSQQLDFGQAILMEKPNIYDPKIQETHENYLKKIVTESGGTFVIYDWDQATNKVELISSLNQTEKPVEVVHFTLPDFFVTSNLTVTFDKNQQNQITAMRIPVEIYMAYIIKSVYLPTNEILNVKSSYIVQPEKTDIVVTDYKKYFGEKNPEMVFSNAKDKILIMNKIRKDFGAEFENRKEKLFSEFRLRFQSKLGHFSSSNTDIYEIDKELYAITEKKKVIKIHPNKSIGIGKQDNFNMYSMSEIGGYPYLDMKISLSVISVDSIDHTVSLGPELFTGKRMANLIETGEQFYAAESERVVNNISYLNKESIVRVSTVGLCNICINSGEEALLIHPAIRLVARDMEELDYFDRLARDERFLDYDLSQLVGRKVGADLLIQFEGDSYTVVEVSTGKVLLKESMTFASFRMKTPGWFRQRYIFNILTNYNQEEFSFKWLETTKESKGKTKEGVIFHPAGLEVYTRYDVYTYEDIEVGGETLKKKRVIAEIRTTNFPLNLHITEVKVRNGEKELTEALSNGTPLYMDRTER